jgi:hypothetical protein
LKLDKAFDVQDVSNEACLDPNRAHRAAPAAGEPSADGTTADLESLDAER